MVKTKNYVFHIRDKKRTLHSKVFRNEYKKPWKKFKVIYYMNTLIKNIFCKQK